MDNMGKLPPTSQELSQGALGAGKAGKKRERNNEGGESPEGLEGHGPAQQRRTADSGADPAAQLQDLRLLEAFGGAPRVHRQPSSSWLSE